MTVDKAPILNVSGSEAGKVDLAPSLFAAPVNEALIHQAVVRQLAGQHLGTADTLTRGQVRGGGRKPWRQKGTGRARQGTRSAPHWKGGGVVFGPHPRGYEQRMPAKMRRAALQGVLSGKADDGALRVPCRARPVPFWRHGFLPPPRTWPRVSVSALPRRWPASWRTTAWWMRASLTGAAKSEGARSTLPFSEPVTVRIGACSIVTSPSARAGRRCARRAPHP